MMVELVGGPKDGEMIAVESRSVTAITVYIEPAHHSIFSAPEPGPYISAQRMGVYLVNHATQTATWDGEL